MHLQKHTIFVILDEKEYNKDVQSAKAVKKWHFLCYWYGFLREHGAQENSYARSPWPATESQKARLTLDFTFWASKFICPARN